MDNNIHPDQIRYEKYCINCDAPANKHCKVCGLPLCEYCAKTGNNVCTSCREDLGENDEYGYRCRINI